MPSSDRTSEYYRLSRDWEHSVEDWIRNVVTGSVVAGLSSLLLFRPGSRRVFWTGMGTGIGLGMSWRNVSSSAPTSSPVRSS